MQTTSKQAYASIVPSLGFKQQVILNALKSLGPSTHKEIAHYLGLEINKVTPRVGELVKLGLVEDRGKKEQDGRKALVWWIKEKQLPLFLA